MVDRIVTLEQAATATGKSPTTIKNWINRGGDMFVVQRARPGGSWRLDLPKLLDWVVEQAVLAAQGDVSKIDYEEARRRKTAAEAALAELDLATRRGELVEIEMVGLQVEEMLTRCRVRLLAMPGNLASALPGETDPNVIQARVFDEVSEALNELAYGDDQSKPTDGATADGAAAGSPATT